MFNYFAELKKSVMQEMEMENFRLIFLGENFLYIEEVKSLDKLEKDCVCVSVKKNKIALCGQDLKLLELGSSTIKVSGKISKIEVF